MLIKPEDEVYNRNYDHPDFRVILELNLGPITRAAMLETPKVVTPAEALKYNYKYLHLLRYKGVDYRIHWLTMRVNGILNPHANILHVRHIFIPEIDYVNDLMNKFRASQEKQEMQALGWRH